MQETSFFWHDYETWGSNPRWDRPAQFAGVRTDLDLNLIGEPVNFYCKPPRDRLPHPMALVVTGISPQYADEQGLIEADFFAEVHRHLSEPGTCGVGYNSIRFDDEVTRYGLYRNFRDPYGREWQNQCGRWDIIDMLRLTRALRPEGINWPVREDGAPSFRLDQLTVANHIEHGAAHDALADVYASIALARLVRQRQPKLYQYVFEHKDKAAARKLLDLSQKTLLLHVSGMFPAERGSIAPVMPLLQHPSNNNGIVVCDLTQDPRAWLDLPAEDITRLLYTSQSDLAENEQRPALKTVHLNKCPVLVPLNTLTDSARREWSIDLQQAEDHRQRLLAAMAGLTPKLLEVFSANPFGPETDPEQALYQGFIDNAERKRCDLVLQLSENPEALATTRIPFKDPRLPELLFRYRARNWPHSLKSEEQQRWHQLCRQHLQQGELSGEALQSEIARLSQERPDRAAVLASLLDWAELLHAEAEGSANEHK
ncbi:MAG: exodeoxyribonuclease I [Gammaproteobacteria bacterium SHHR-1]